MGNGVGCAWNRLTTAQVSGFMYASVLSAPMGTRNRESAPPRRFIEAGERLRLTREAAGFSTALAFAKKLNVANSTYNRYENGETFPKPDAMDALRTLYGVDYGWISRGELWTVPPDLAKEIEKRMNEEKKTKDTKRHQA